MEQYFSSTFIGASSGGVVCSLIILSGAAPQANTHANPYHDHRQAPQGEPEEVLRPAAQGPARPALPRLPRARAARPVRLRPPRRRWPAAVGGGPRQGPAAARRQLALGRRDDRRLHPRRAALPEW